MTHFNRQALEHLKKLCRIELEASEELAIEQSLNRVLGYISQLSEVKTEGVKPCTYVLREGGKEGLRPDVPGETLSQDKFLSNAPDQIGGMIRVPPVLKGS
jgi:aspartyl-tRNA(Asn)/glutamyl-tRNA(Gln) amidotransferase subunit C